MSKIDEVGTKAADALRDDDRVPEASYRRGRRGYGAMFAVGVLVAVALVAYLALRDRTGGASVPQSSATERSTR